MRIKGGNVIYENIHQNKKVRKSKKLQYYLLTNTASHGGQIKHLNLNANTFPSNANTNTIQMQILSVCCISNIFKYLFIPVVSLLWCMSPCYVHIPLPAPSCKYKHKMLNDTEVDGQLQ